MSAANRREFARLMGEANREARLVRRDVLDRMHSGLPDAFAYFVTATYYIGPMTLKRRLDRRVMVVVGRWVQWWNENWADIQVPRGALP
jgi:hypothetical protein